MDVLSLIYRKEMILASLKSMGRDQENISKIMGLCNKDKSFLHGCVRDFRGGLTITKRIERLRSGNRKY